MGRPKAWLPVSREVLLQRVVRLLNLVCEPVIVVGGPNQRLPELPSEIRVVCDEVEGLGPLQGLATGLANLDRQVDLVYVTATDAPFFQPAWVQGLVDCIGSADLALPDAGDKLHPLAAIYRREPTRIAAEQLLRERQLRLLALRDRLETRIVTEPELRSFDPTLATLRNLNNPQDYRNALVELESHPDEAGREVAG
jgi:molybdopterin-guanine dinucleotide biosynthesis protein A